jgi:hypothetical protein
VTAIEVVAEFAAQLRAAPNGAPVQVLETDLFSEQLLLPRSDYQLVVLAEVTSHFRGPDQLRRAFSILAGALAPGGTLVTNAFLTRKGYQTDAAARQTAMTAWSAFYTREEVAAAIAGLPLELISDESVHDYEQAHLPPEHWPPTGWFISWTLGRNVFDLPDEETPIEMRWLVLRRH